MPPLLFLPSIFPSIRDFSSEPTLPFKWPKYCHFSFGISPSSEYTGLISFRIDWFDFFAVQGMLRSLLQHHSSKASTLKYSTFFMVQFSYPYMTTGKTIALTRRTYLSWQNVCILILCLGFHSFSSKEQASFNFMVVVTICRDFGAQENKVCHCFHYFHIYLS